MPFFRDNTEVEEIENEVLKISFHPDDILACCMCCCCFNICGLCCQCWCGICCLFYLCFDWDDEYWTFFKEGEVIHEKRNHLCPFLIEDIQEYEILPINPAFANSTVTDGYQGRYQMRISLKGLNGEPIDMSEEMTSEDIDEQMKLIETINGFYTRAHKDVETQEEEKILEFTPPESLENIVKSAKKEERNIYEAVGEDEESSLIENAETSPIHTETNDLLD